MVSPENHSNRLIAWVTRNEMTDMLELTMDQEFSQVIAADLGEAMFEISGALRNSRLSRTRVERASGVLNGLQIEYKNSAYTLAKILSHLPEQGGPLPIKKTSSPGSECAFFLDLRNFPWHRSLFKYLL